MSNSTKNIAALVADLESKLACVGAASTQTAYAKTLRNLIAEAKASLAIELEIDEQTSLDRS